ncbi:MAG: Ig-like domain-containing protein, partial [Clostridia bacterium]|nr:Ig-like domain-containing protein [Clostridia bacterium]
PDPEQPQPEATPVEPDPEQPQPEATPVEPEPEQPEIEQPGTELAPGDDEEDEPFVSVPVTITFKNTRKTIGYKETYSLNPVAYDARGNAVETTFKYSTSAAKYVSIKGEAIYGAAKGKAVITVTAENGVSQSVTITTVSAPTKVTIKAPYTEIAVGETVSFGYAYPAGQDGSVTWKAEKTSIAKVDSNGKVTGVAKGTTRIRVDTYNKKYALITIKIVDAPQSITFAQSKYKVGEGGSIQTVGTVSPAGAYSRATYEIIGNDALSVDKNGKVTHKLNGALGKGTLRAKIRNYVTGKDIYAECEIEIVPAPVTIKFKNQRTTIGQYETVNLEPYALDGRGKEVATTFKLTSGNTRYVTIKSGNVYGAGRGTATVTVTAANGASAKIDIKTVYAPSKVTLSAPSTEMTVGETMQLGYTLPSNAVGKVTWKAENTKVLKVDANGLVTAIAAGTTRVRVDTYNKKYALVTIKVTAAPEKLSFNESVYNVGTGCKLPTALTIQPKGAALKVTYKLSNSKYASIDKNGVLKGIEVGTVKLTATVHNYVTNKDIVAECTVNVIPGPHTIEFENTRTTIGYKETMDLKPVAYNKNGEAVETTFTYKSSNTRYVTLKDNGIYGKA